MSESSPRRIIDIVNGVKPQELIFKSPQDAATWLDRKGI
jgi:hypothetical protein